MRMKTLCSGSNGNCYVLESNSGKKLILDIGISKKDLMKGIDFDVKNIAGVVVTHSHG